MFIFTADMSLTASRPFRRRYEQILYPSSKMDQFLEKSDLYILKQRYGQTTWSCRDRPTA